MMGSASWAVESPPAGPRHPHLAHPPSFIPHSRSARGFTLVEILVALAIFAVMALASYRGLSAMLDAREQVETENHKWRSVALLFLRLENDLEAILNRPIRGASDLVLPAFAGNAVIYGEDDAQLAFTRNGHAGQDGTLAAPQRVGYRLRGETLELLTWAALDQAPRSRPAISRGLEGVSRFDLRYLDQSGSWQTQWPLPGPNPALPAAVEARITLRTGESVMRVFALP